jgi:hypothetical protein
MSSETMDLGDNPGSRIEPEPPVLIPQHGSTGGRKPYNVRLRLDLVAEAMDKPQSQGLSLAGLIEQLLEGYVAKG